jgi:RimJ/RimL family protein N-acetyltransferase
MGRTVKTIIFERDSSLDDLYAKNGIYLTCYLDGEKIGYFCVFKGHSFEKQKLQEVAIWLADEFRGKGYSKAIYSAFIEKAVSLGFKNHVFYAVITEDNIPSIKACERLKFKKIPNEYPGAVIYQFKSN